MLEYLSSQLGRVRRCDLVGGDVSLAGGLLVGPLSAFYLQIKM